MKKFFLILSLPLLASSCENEEGQVDSLGPSDVQVSLRANLNNYSSEITNFSKASFEENTTVSVLADVETGAHFDLNTFTALADGTLKYSGEGALYYPQGRIVRFISLYPSPEDWTSWNPETQSLSVLYTRQKNNDYIEKQKSGKTPTQKHVGHVRQQALLHFRILKHPTRRLFNI